MAKKEAGPDQARSWAIAMAGCVINSLLSGISRSSGVFYVALIDTYGVSRMEANIPFTMRNVVRNLSSPVTGVIGQRYGAQGVTFLGGILASLGVGLCCFAPNVTWITVFWGGMHGLGVALGNTLFPVIIIRYFLKYRATASGLSLSGACIGTIVLPIALEYMLKDFGLSGAFLISGSLILHVLPAALLMTEPPWLRRKLVVKKNAGSNERNNTLRNVTHTEKLGTIGEHCEVSYAKEKTASTGVICEDVAKVEDDFQPATRDASVFSRSGIDNPAFVGSKADVSDPTMESKEEKFQPVILMRTISIGEVNLTVSQSEVQETSLKKGIVKVVGSPMFHMISISMVGLSMLSDPVLTVIVDYAMDKGLLEDDANYFIIVLSVGDLLGRLCFGWVTDRNYMTPSKFMLVVQVVQGVCFLLLPLCYRFHILVIIFMIYGLASGANLVMYPILVSKYLPSVQSLAISSVLVFTGILSFTIPLLIGYFRDNAGSYNGMFVITGSLSVAVGCLWLLEPFFVRLENTRRETTQVSP